MIAITTLALFMMHGAIYLVMKTEKRLYTKLTILVKNFTIFFVISFALSNFLSPCYIREHLTERIKANTALFIIPLIMILAVANIPRCLAKKKLQAGLFQFFCYRFSFAGYRCG